MSPNVSSGGSGVSSAALTHNFVLFCQLLREHGLNIPTGAAADLMTVAELVDLADKPAFYLAARSLLTGDRREWLLFESLFHAFWRRRGATDDGLEIQRPAGRGLEPPPARLAGTRRKSPRPGGLERPTSPGTFGSRPVAEGISVGNPEEAHPAASWMEAARSPDLRTLSASEVTSALRLVAAARRAVPERTLRRKGPGPKEVRLDLRGTLRLAARHRGELVGLRFHDLRRERRSLVLLCDVSRSMRPFTRAVLGLPYALSTALDRVEVFFFSTQLTRVTHLLWRRSPEGVLRALAAEVSDWGSGTRIGSALSAFNRQWARKVLSVRAVVVLLTDGLDAGDAGVLAAEACALRRRCWRLVWLNPLAGGPGFEPRAGGIRALLPHVDVMLPCSDIGSLLRFLEIIRDFHGWRDLDPSLSPASGVAVSVPGRGGSYTKGIHT